MWSETLEQAAEAHRAAAGYLDDAHRGVRDGRLSNDGAAVLIEQAEGETERAARFIGQALRAVQHAA